MIRGLIALLSPIALVAILIACGDDGGTPTSPTTPGSPSTPTGPPPTAPSLQAPETGEPVSDAQPTLTIGNATGGSGTRTYTIDLAVDSAFANMALSETGIREGLGGITHWQVTEPLLPETKYFWRARATASGVNGPYSDVSEFRIREAFVKDRASGGVVLFDPLVGGSIGQVTGGRFVENGWQAISNEDFIRYQIPTLPEGMIEFQTTNLSEPNPVAGKRALIIMWDPTKGEYTTNPFRMHLQKMDRNTVSFDDVRLRWISRGQEHNEGISFFDFEPDIVYNWKIEWGSFPGINAQQVRVWLDGFQILLRNYDPIYHPKTHWVELGSGPRGETLEQAIWSNVRISQR